MQTLMAIGGALNYEDLTLLREFVRRVGGRAAAGIRCGRNRVRILNILEILLGLVF